MTFSDRCVAVVVTVFRLVVGRKLAFAGQWSEANETTRLAANDVEVGMMPNSVLHERGRGRAADGAAAAVHAAHHAV